MARDHAGKAWSVADDETLCDSKVPRIGMSRMQSTGVPTAGPSGIM